MTPAEEVFVTRASELGITLSSDASIALSAAPRTEAFRILDACKGRAEASNWICITAKLSETGLYLPDDVQDELADIPSGAALSLLTDIANKQETANAIRNVPGYVSAACRRMRSKQGVICDDRDIANEAAALGLDLDQQAIDGLASLPLKDAQDLLHEVVQKSKEGSGIRNPSGFIDKACIRMQDRGRTGQTRSGKGSSTSSSEKSGKGAGQRRSSEAYSAFSGGTGGGGRSGGGGKSGGGGRSGVRAAELGMNLSPAALNELQSMALDDALNLLEDVATGPALCKGQTHSEYILAVCARVNGGDVLSHPVEHAAQLGVTVTSQSEEALMSVPLLDALELVEDVASRGTGKHAINNVEGYMVAACKKMRSGQMAGRGTKSAQRAQEIGLRLNRTALEALSKIHLSTALKIVEDVGASRSRDPSAAIQKMCREALDSGNPVSDYSFIDGIPSGMDRDNMGRSPEALWKKRGRGPSVEDRLGELGLNLDVRAKEYLSSIALEAGLALVEDIAAKGTGKGGIRKPSAYVISACEKLLHHQPRMDMPPPAKRHRADSPYLPTESIRNPDLDALEDEINRLELDFSSDAMDALTRVPIEAAFRLLESIAEKGVGEAGVRNPSAFVITACDKIMDTQRAAHGPARRDRRGSSDRDAPLSLSHTSSAAGRVGLRASQLGLGLSQKTCEALDMIPEQDALQLLDDIETRLTGPRAIRNPDNYIFSVCEKANSKRQQESDAAIGGDQRTGDRAAERAAELGLHLQSESLNELSSVPLASALELVEKIASKGGGKGGIRNPTGYISSACAKIRDGEVVGKGTKSATHAAELGINLDEDALRALSELQLSVACALLDSIASKGSGRGKVRDPSAFVLSACRGIQHDRRDGGGAGSKSAARAVELGLNLSSDAKEALASLRLNEALALVEEVAGKGGVRNPSGYIIKACGKLNGDVKPAALPLPIPKEEPTQYVQGGTREPYDGSSEGDEALRAYNSAYESSGASNEADTRTKPGAKQTRRDPRASIDEWVVDLNERGFWEKDINVASLVALKRLSRSGAGAVLDELEEEAMKNGVEDPREFIKAAVEHELEKSRIEKRRREEGGGNDREQALRAKVETDDDDGAYH